MKSEELETLIRANHILHYQEVLDAYGHVSLRHPDKPDVFIMSGDRAPALVSSPSDLIEYNISDSSPVDPKSKRGYQERFIHSEIYKRYPNVNSVIHSHSDAVLPYTMNGVPMKPSFHIAGFLGTHVPVYDIIPLYQPGDQQDMLVKTERLGSALASTFSSSSEQKEEHDHNVVLMSNHGFTVVGSSVKQAVYRAVYTRVNASIQSQALILRSAASFMSSALSGSGTMPSSGPGSISGFGNSGLGGEGGGAGLGEMRFLDKKELSEGCMKMNDSSQDRPWALWVREVEASPLYRIEK